MIATVAITRCDSLGPHNRDNTYDPGSPVFEPKSAESLSVTIQQNTVTLSWTDHSNHEDGYLIERALRKNQEFQEIDRLPPDSDSFTDEIDGEPFWVRYRVTPYSESGDTLRGRPIQTDYLSFRPFDNMVPDTDLLSETRIRLSWPGIYTKNVFYVIERRTENTGAKQEPVSVILDTLGGDVTTYIDSVALHTSIIREYRIRAISANEEGPYSRYQRIRPGIPPPRELVLGNKGTTEKNIQLMWLHRYPELLDGYYLEIRPEGGDWSRLAQICPDTNMFQHTLPDTQTNYSFRIKSIVSDYSNTLSITYDSTLVLRKHRKIRKGAIHYLAMNPSEEIIYYYMRTNADNTRLKAWKWRDDINLFSIRPANTVQDVAFSAQNGNMLVATGSSHNWYGNLQLIDGSTGELIRTLIDQPTFVAALHPDGMSYVSFENSPNIQVRDINTDTLVYEYSLTKWGGGFTDAEFHPTAPYLAIATRGGEVEIFKRNTEESRWADVSAPHIAYDRKGTTLFAGRKFLDPVEATIQKNLDPMLPGYLSGKNTLGPLDRIHTTFIKNQNRHCCNWGNYGLAVYNKDGTLWRNIRTFNNIPRRIVAYDEGNLTVTVTGNEIYIWAPGKRWQVK